MEENLVHNSLDFLKVLEKFTLESKLLACQQFSSRIMTCSQVDMVKAYKENIMPWEIEAFAAYSIVYDNDDASEKLDGKTFADTITLIRNYWHSGLTAAEESGEYPEAFMMISALQQFPVQTESMLNRITLGDSKLRRAIGKEVIEGYLYDIVSQLDSVTWVSPEIEYRKGKDKLLTSDVIAAEGDAAIFYDTKAITPSLKLRKFDAAEIENDVRIYAEDVIQIYNQVKNYLQGLFQLDKVYSKDNIYGIVVVLEDAVVSRKKVYEKVYALLEETATLSEEEKNYICSHIKVLPLRAIECMILQNTSLLPELKEQLDKPEKWYDYTYTNATVENGLISTYAQYEQNIKERISKQT